MDFVIIDVGIDHLLLTTIIGKAGKSIHDQSGLPTGIEKGHRSKGAIRSLAEVRAVLVPN